MKARVLRKGRVRMVQAGNARVRIFARMLRRKFASGERTYRQFEVYWFDFDGVLHRKFRNSPQEAEALARTKAEELAQGSRQADLHPEDVLTYKRAWAACIDDPRPMDEIARDGAEARRMMPGMTFTEMAKFCARHIGPKVASGTVAEILPICLADKKRTELIGQRHYQDFKDRLAFFGRAFPGPVKDIMAAEIKTWLNVLPVANRTRNNYLGALKNFWNWCEAAVPPFVSEEMNRAVQKLRKAKVAGAEKPIYEPAQLRALLDAAELEGLTEMIPYLVIGAFADMRSAEMEKLPVRAICLNKGQIEVSADVAKGRKGNPKPRTILLSENLKRWLLTFPPRAKGLDDLLAPPNFRRKLVRIARAANVRWLNNGLRRSAISYAKALGISLEDVAKQAGNSPQIAEANYLNRTAKFEEAIQWFGLNPHLQGARQTLLFPSLAQR